MILILSYSQKLSFEPCKSLDICIEHNRYTIVTNNKFWNNYHFMVLNKMKYPIEVELHDVAMWMWGRN